MGALLGVGMRLEFGLLMIPIQAAAALGQGKQRDSERITRLVVLGIALAAVIVGIHELRNVTAAPLSVPQPRAIVPASAPAQKKLKHKVAPLTAGTRHEILNGDPASAANWMKAEDSGVATFSFFSPQPLEIRAQPTNPPSGVVLCSKTIFTGDVDATFVLNHQGFGRTNVGIWSATRNTWDIVVTLDTDDTNFLSFAAGGPSTEGKHSGSPFMNKWTTIQIKTAYRVTYFLVDDREVERLPQLAAGPFRVAVNVGCASWKSGANDTVFQSITTTDILQ
jgi:hypothetical protein